MLLVIVTTIFQVLNGPAYCLIADADSLTLAIVLQPRVDLYIIQGISSAFPSAHLSKVLCWSNQRCVLGQAKALPG